ncbi:hypothetical protein Dimus_025133, partial [Dionaea muscipula]
TIMLNTKGMVCSRAEASSLSSQRAKVRYFSQCDRNSSFFHAILKSHRSCRHIATILDNDNKVLHAPAQVAEEFIRNYKHLLGPSKAVTDFDEHTVNRGALVSAAAARRLIKPS